MNKTYLFFNSFFECFSKNFFPDFRHFLILKFQFCNYVENVRFVHNVNDGFSGVEWGRKMNINAIFLVFRKIFVCLVMVSFCFGGYAETYTMRWLNEDGTVNQTTTCNAGDDLILPTPPTKPGFTFVGWDSYTPIEYLESTGTQYIDTGISPNDTSKIIISIQIASNFIGSDQKLFGNTTDVRMDLHTYKGYYRGTNITVSPNKTEIIIQRSFPASTASLSVEYDNNIYTQENNSWWDCTHAAAIFPIFGSCGCNNSVCRARYKCFYFKQYDLFGVLVRDMIPVLDFDGVPCMFDKVSEQFFYNLGTGNFFAGPEISE